MDLRQFEYRTQKYKIIAKRCYTQFRNLQTDQVTSLIRKKQRKTYNAEYRFIQN